MRNKSASRWHHANGKGEAYSSNGTRQGQTLRVREPVGRSFGSVRGKFPSKKNGRMIHWESQLERDAVYIFEFSPGVIKYQEQPFKTHYTFEGQTRRYTPDFTVTLSTGECIVVEVKPAERLLDPSERRRFDRIANHIQQLGFPFQILTEQEIRRPHLLENLQWLHRYRGERLTSFERRRFIDLLSAAQEITFASVESELTDPAAIWNLIGEGILICNLREPLTAGTILHLALKEGQNADVYF